MLTPILVMSGVGTLAAIGLGIASKVFYVEEDPRIGHVLDLLPVFRRDIEAWSAAVESGRMPADFDRQAEALRRALPAMDGCLSRYLVGDVPWRPHYHHEHSPCYVPDNAYQCLTGKTWKYIWNPINGREQLFHRQQDPFEEQDLSDDPAHAETLASWRGELARHIAGRYVNLSDGVRLTPSNVPVWRDPTGASTQPAEAFHVC